MDNTLQSCIFFSLFFVIASAGPQFCTRGFQLASRFHKCWEQATYSNKYPPLFEPREFLDAQFFENYANHMCSVVKPQALKCLDRDVKECENRKKVMEIADQSGGACEGNHLNPFFKKHVIEHLVAVKSDSPCFELADNSYECYTLAGQKVMRMGSEADNIVTFHKVADKFFNAYWDCMVTIYKSNIQVCPNWQIPMLLTLQKTAMPSLFGLRLKPEQVAKLELSNVSTKDLALKPGPSTLYLLLQLHKDKPDPEGEGQAEDSLVLELSNLNDENPKIHLEGGSEGQEDKEHVFTLKEIKTLMREQRRRNKELRDFINQAKGLANKRKKGGEKEEASKKKKKVYRKKLNIDSMIA